MSVHEHWDITVDTPVGQQRGSLELRVTEAACTGRLYSEAGELALHNGTAQDNELSWELQLSRPIPMTIKCQARIHGDTIQGTAMVAAFGDITFTGTRGVG